MTGKKLLLLNLLILLGVLVCAEELISGWREFESQQNLAQVVARASSQPVETVPDGSRLLDGTERLHHDFFVVAERNLFAPERRLEAVDEAEEAAAQAPEFEQRPRINGVTERGGERLALLTIYESKKDSGRTELVAVGGDVNGYTVTEITDTALTLTWNDHNVVIDMLDSEPAKPVAKAPPKIAALKIIRIGSKVAAVESTSPEAVAAEEGRGLQVGVVGGQAAGQRTGGRTGLAGRGGMMDRSSGAGNLGRSRQGMGSQGRGFPSTVGGLGGRQSMPNQQRRY